MLDQPFERLPAEIQSVEAGIAPLERGDHPQGLRIVVEAAAGLEAAIERALAGMAERRVAKIMGERQCLGQVLVQSERARKRAGDLGDLERVGKAGAEMIALVEDEDLGLMRKPAESGRMDDAVAVAPKGVAGRARRLRREPPAARWPDRTHRGRVRLPLRPPCFVHLRRLTNAVGALNYPSAPPGNRHSLEQHKPPAGRGHHGHRTGRPADRRDPAPRACRHHAARERRGRRLLRFPVQVRHRAGAAADDVVIQRAGATVLIDQVSLGYLAGSEIDFVDDLIGASFRINNPKATASCGCGTSFSI